MTLPTASYASTTSLVVDLLLLLSIMWSNEKLTQEENMMHTPKAKDWMTLLEEQENRIEVNVQTSEERIWIHDELNAFDPESRWLAEQVERFGYEVGKLFAGSRVCGTRRRMQHS